MLIRNNIAGTAINYYLCDMNILIDKPTDETPEYIAWTIDCPSGLILGAGKTIEEAKADFENSLIEFKNNEDTIDSELLEFMKEERSYYIQLD